ncbi:MAG: hypothetical protein EHM41_06535 [Chloroflexi bacterium]|nr:MAG: hypothetical protein EHM41_06535 [Chloroflexota bacterium]
MEPEFEQILSSSLPDTEKLARAFLSILHQRHTQSQNEIELQKALGDDQALLKEQIKSETLKYSGEILAFCYYRVTGRKMKDV